MVSRAGMTMRAMAAQAGVSPATPYNLLGSNQAIYDEDHASFSRYFEGQASSDALIRIFDLVAADELHAGNDRRLRRGG